MIVIYRQGVCYNIINNASGARQKLRDIIHEHNDADLIIEHVVVCTDL